MMVDDQNCVIDPFSYYLGKREGYVVLDNKVISELTKDKIICYDVSDNRTVMKRAGTETVDLRKWDLLITAYNGEDALNELEILDKYNLLPHLILLDVKMPKLSGDKVCKKLKNNKKYRNIPTYLFSGKSESELENLNSGADGFLTKPSTNKDILKLFNEKFGEH
jgi:CheY-like chemotaxis protein